MNSEFKSSTVELLSDEDKMFLEYIIKNKEYYIGINEPYLIVQDKRDGTYGLYVCKGWYLNNLFMFDVVEIIKLC